MHANRLLLMALVSVIAASAARCEADDIGKYGFRYDPMKWVETDQSVGAAKLRTFVFKKPQPGDHAILKKEIESILAKQHEDGSFHGAAQPPQATASHVLRLLELGCSPDRPEIKRAMAFFLREGIKDDGTIGVYKLRVLCLIGGDEHAALRDKSLRKLAAVCEEGDHLGCPWTPAQSLRTLWAGRDYVDVQAGLMSELKWIAEGMNEAGCLSYKDPWGFLSLAATIDHPLGRQITVKLVPLILRNQRADGGWGGQSINVFRALKRYGLMGQLTTLPPLPQDWRIVRTIPAPPGVYTMAWDGESLWVSTFHGGEAIAVSPTDGRVVRRVKLPGRGFKGIGWWDGALVVVAHDPNRLLQIDPATGKIRREIPLGKDRMADPAGVAEVNGKLWVGDNWNWVAAVIDPDHIEPPEQQHYAVPGLPITYDTDLAVAPDGVWLCSHTSLARSDPRGRLVARDEMKTGVPNLKLLEWGEKPFARIGGITHDGKNLWVQDRKGQRLCVIERANFQAPNAQFARQIRAELPYLKKTLNLPKVVTLPEGVARKTFENTVRNPFDVPLTIRFEWDMCASSWGMAPASEAVTIEPGAEVTLRTVATFDRQKLAPAPVRRSIIAVGGRDMMQIENFCDPPLIPRSATAVRVAKPPKPDGVIAEDEYGKASANGMFADYRGVGPATHATRFLAAYNDKALYIAMIADEPEPQGIVGEPVERDANIFTSDEVELFVDATFDRSTYHQFAVQLKHGVQFDLARGPEQGEHGSSAWNGQWKSGVKIGKDAFVVEFAIPFATLGVKPPKAGDRWGLNIARQRVPDGKQNGRLEQTAWSVTYGSFHVPDRFGTVTFE